MKTQMINNGSGRQNTNQQRFDPSWIIHISTGNYRTFYDNPTGCTEYTQGGLKPCVKSSVQLRERPGVHRSNLKGHVRLLQDGSLVPLTGFVKLLMHFRLPFNFPGTPHPKIYWRHQTGRFGGFTTNQLSSTYTAQTTEHILAEICGLINISGSFHHIGRFRIPNRLWPWIEKIELGTATTSNQEKFDQSSMDHMIKILEYKKYSSLLDVRLTVIIVVWC